jgi:hypothetical protein
MDDVALREALSSYVTTDEPPPRTVAAEVLTAGRQARRRHRLALLATGLAVVMAGVAMKVGLPWALSPASTPGASLATAACPSPPAPGAGSPEIRMTCYLTSVVPRMLGEARFIRLYGPRGTLPLQAYPSTDIPGAYEANAVVHDAAGLGSVIFVVGRQSGETPSGDACASKGGCSVRQGPHGELVEVHAAVSTIGSDIGHVGVTIYVYTGRTTIIAGTSNSGERRFNDAVSTPERAVPPLTTEQLIEIATAPDLALFD